MDPPLHQLCQLCQNFQLQITSRRGKWEDMGSYGRWWNVTRGENSPPKRHHRDFDALLESARNGCHLCSLLSFAFKNDDLAWAKHTGVWSHSNIMIKYQSTNSYDAERDVTTEDSVKLGNLIVEWRDRSVQFDVVRWPISNCYIESFVEPIMWPVPLGTAMERIHSPTLVKVLARQDAKILVANPIYPTSRPWWTSAAGYYDILQEPHLLCCCGKGVWEPPLLERGQSSYVSTNPLAPQLRNQVNQWLDLCENSCRHYPMDMSSLPMPLRLIDVGPADGSIEPRLSIAKGRRGIYITLTYRWGETGAFRTLDSALEELQNQIPFEKLPQTVKDAITVCRWLNVKYLWVDALCIVQDTDDFFLQSPLMHEIYGNAWLNISADAAEDSSMGFLQRRNPQHHHTLLHPSLLRTPNKTTISVGICPNYPKSDRIPDRSTLATRGWIMQERLLSKRRLHFAEYQVFWECRSFQACERITGPEFYENGCGSEWSLPLEMRIHGTTGYRIDPFDEWSRLMDHYSVMNLTRPSDRLAALAGLVHEFVERTDAKLTYIMGLWKEYLIPSLLWGIVPDLVTNTMRSKIKDGTKIRGYCAPSFSWASVNVPIRFSDTCELPGPDHVKLVDYNVVPANINDTFGYGSVKDGWIKLDGWTAPFKKLRPRGRFLRNGMYTELDDEHHIKLSDEAECRVLCLMVSPHYTECLALLPADSSNSTYRRIGLFRGRRHWKEIDVAWARQTITVV